MNIGQTAREMGEALKKVSHLLPTDFKSLTWPNAQESIDRLEAEREIAYHKWAKLPSNSHEAIVLNAEVRRLTHLILGAR